MRTSQGEPLEGATPKEWVASLRQNTHFPEKDTRTFMRQTARRAKVQTGKPVRYNTAENFINDLLKAGLLLENDGAKQVE